MTVLLASWSLVTLPVNCVVDSVPNRVLAVLAMMAYGDGRIGCRGLNVENSPLPLVRTRISSQRFVPVKTSGPKSGATLKSPLVTAVVFVTMGPRWLPSKAAS